MVGFRKIEEIKVERKKKKSTHTKRNEKKDFKKMTSFLPSRIPKLQSGAGGMSSSTFEEKSVCPHIHRGSM